MYNYNIFIILLYSILQQKKQVEIKEVAVKKDPASRSQSGNWRVHLYMYLHGHTILCLPSEW